MWQAEREFDKRRSQKAANTNNDEKHRGLYQQVEQLELEDYTNSLKLSRHRPFHKRRSSNDEYETQTEEHLHSNNCHQYKIMREEEKRKKQPKEFEEKPHRQEQEEESEEEEISQMEQLQYCNETNEKEQEHTHCYDVVDLLQQMSSVQRTIQSVSSSCEHCKTISEKFIRAPHSHCNQLAELFTDLGEFANSHDMCVEGIVKRELVHCVLPLVSSEIDKTCSLHEAALQDLLDSFKETVQNHVSSTTNKVEVMHQTMQSTQNIIDTLQTNAKESMERINALTRQVEEYVLQQVNTKKKSNSRKSDTNETDMFVEEQLQLIRNQFASIMTRNELHDKFAEMKEELKTMIYKETTEQLHEPLKILTEFTANTANVTAEQEVQLESRVLNEVCLHVDAKIQEQLKDLINSYKIEEAKERKLEMRRWKEELQQYIQEQISTYTNHTHQNAHQQEQEQEQLILVDVRVAALQKSIHILEGALTSVCGELQEVRTDLRKSESALNSQLHVLRDQLQRLELHCSEEQREHEQEFGALYKQSNLNSSFYELRDWLTDLEKRVVSQGQLREKLTPIEEQLAELRRIAQASLHENNSLELQ